MEARTRLAIIAGLLVLLVAVAGCLGASGPSSAGEQVRDTPVGQEGADAVPIGSIGEGSAYDGGGDVYRFVDEEEGVVCYIYDSKLGGEYGHAGGISCVPMEATR